MKKLLFSTAILLINFTFGQIVLDHSFPEEQAIVYKNENQTFYITTKYDSNIIKIYNADYSLYKTITLEIPTGYYNYSFSFPDADNFPFISKNIFNTDDKLELLIAFKDSGHSKLRLINEDGLVIKNFDNKYYDYSMELFTDKTVNKNKLVLINTTNTSEIYSLPTSSLSSKEIETVKKLYAFPIPASQTLNIINPQNGSNKIEIYDASGKQVMRESFGLNENRVSIDVESLPKGNYIYKIGNLSSKFIKN